MRECKNRRPKEQLEESVRNLGYYMMKEYVIKRGRSYKRMVYIRDNIGYKYTVWFDMLISKRKPYFVAPNNPDSLYNISLWISVNNLSISICNDNTYKNSDEKLKFQCKNCWEFFYENWRTIRKNKACPFCSKRSVGKYNNLEHEYSFVINVWDYSKNKTSPSKHLSSENKTMHWWKCEKGIHKSYKRTIHNSVRCDFRCPACSREDSNSILQNKVIKYFSNNYKYLTEYSCNIVPKNPKNGRYMPYDIEIPSLFLVIEVNGEQHYKCGGWHKSSARRNGTTPHKEFENQLYRDEYKKQYAISNGYDFLEIPYWSDNKNKDYIKIIENKVSEILKKDSL